MNQARIFLSYSSQCETSEMRLSLQTPHKKPIIMRIRCLMRIRSSSLDQEADAVWVMSLNCAHLFLMRIRVYNAYSRCMCRATGNSHDAPVSQPFFKLETCFDFYYFTEYLEYHSLFGMGPKKRTMDQPVASQELLEIREKKRKLSKWMEGGAEGAAGKNTRNTRPRRPTRAICCNWNSRSWTTR